MSNPIYIAMFCFNTAEARFKCRNCQIKHLVGAVIILIPSIPVMFKEWSYVGFGILLLSASLAHWIVYGMAKGFAPLVPFAVFSVSYYYFRKLNYAK